MSSKPPRKPRTPKLPSDAPGDAPDRPVPPRGFECLAAHFAPVLTADPALPSAPSGKTKLRPPTILDEAALRRALENAAPRLQRRRPSDHGDEAASRRLLGREESDRTEQAVSRAAVDYGLWWHETMETSPWASGADSVTSHWQRRLAAAQTQSFHVRARNELALLYKGELFRRLTASGIQAWTEIPFSHCPDPATLEDGVIDLLFRENGRWILLDWKTDFFGGSATPGPEQIAATLAKYRPQLHAYRAALDKMGLPPAEVFLYLTAPGRLETLD